MLDEFIQYLIEQIGQPYLWGGQHTKLTPENYKTIIHKKESGTGGYKGGPSYEEAAIEYCKKLFDEGAKELFAYDCSGLGMFWIEDVKRIWKSDATADRMMNKCVELINSEPPEKGWWVFRTENGKATHIGYMIDNEYLIEAKGRKYGVVKTKWKFDDWDIWGIPSIFENEIRPEPVPPEPPVTEQMVKVIGKSVRIRKAPSTLSKTVKIAHKGDKYPYFGTAENGWYQIELPKYGAAYITGKPKYTKLVEK